MIYLINIESRDFEGNESICIDSFYIQSSYSINIVVKAVLIDYCRKNYTSFDIDNIWIKNFTANNNNYSITIADNDGVNVKISGLNIEVNGDITGTTKILPREIIDMAATLPDNCNIYEEDDIQNFFDTIEEYDDNE